MFRTYITCCFLGTDHTDLLETIIRKLTDQKPEPSIFICGDFNFALGRKNFKGVLRRYNAEIFPDLSNRLYARQSDRKEPIDYVLVRTNSGHQMKCREFDITLLTKGNDQDAETPNVRPQTVNSPEYSETKVESSIKKEATTDVTDSKQPHTYIG
jgi:hypothetical protein